MVNQKKLLFFISLLTCTMGYLFSWGWESITVPDNVPKAPTISSPSKKRFSLSGNNRTESHSFIKTSNNQDAEKGSLYLFVKKLHGNLEPHEYSTLFDELLSSSFSSESSLKMSLLLNKWGKTAPRQALEKILGMEDVNVYWIPEILGYWAEKDPDNAISFYLESQDSRIKANPYIVRYLCGNWAKHDPRKAWDWLHAQKGGLLDSHFQWAKNSIACSVADHHPEQIPEFIKKLNDRDLEGTVYFLGEKWGEIHPESSEWVERLDESKRIPAEAGRIMGSAKGELKNILTLLSSFDKEQQTAIAKELAIPLLAPGGLDTKDKVDWILDTIPEEQLNTSIRKNIQKWLYEDRAEAEKWINSLPTGSKKEKLQKMFKHDGVNCIF